MNWLERIIASKALLLLTLLAIGVTSALAAGNSFIVADLRVDLPAIYNAKNYQVVLLADGLPTTGNSQNFGTAWLGVFLGSYDGTSGSGKFTQVGLLATRNGLQWFVYAEPGVTCLRGSQPDPNYCYGDYGDIVGLDQWHRVRLYRGSDGYWYARVYDSTGVNYSNVAKILDTSPRIYLARSDTEEGYYENSDPYILLRYYHWHPQFLSSGTWTDWPESDSTAQSNIWTAPSSICPNHYGATPNIFNDERAWYAGTGGVVCSWLLFPSVHVFLPVVLQ